MAKKRTTTGMKHEVQGQDTNGFKTMAGPNRSDRCRFGKVETKRTSYLLSGCKKILMSEQLYTQRHNNVCRVIRWHICKNFNIPVPENSWKHEPKAITENKEVPLTYDLMIPSSVHIENEALQPDIVLRHKRFL